MGNAGHSVRRSARSGTHRAPAIGPPKGRCAQTQQSGMNSCIRLPNRGVLAVMPRQGERRASRPGGGSLPAAGRASPGRSGPNLGQVVTGRITDHQWRNEVGRRLAASYPHSLAEEAVVAWSRPVGTVNRDVLHMVTLARMHCTVGLVTNATDRLPHDLTDRRFEHFHAVDRAVHHRGLTQMIRLGRRSRASPAYTPANSPAACSARRNWA
jgi:hypothetical protein